MITLPETLLRALAWIWSPTPTPLGCLSNEEIDERLSLEEAAEKEAQHA